MRQKSRGVEQISAAEVVLKRLQIFTPSDFIVAGLKENAFRVLEILFILSKFSEARIYCVWENTYKKKYTTVSIEI